MFGAGDDGFLASGVPLGEGLWPVCFDGFDEAVPEGFAFELDGEFEFIPEKGSYFRVKFNCYKE